VIRRLANRPRERLRRARFLSYDLGSGLREQSAFPLGLRQGRENSSSLEGNDAAAVCMSDQAGTEMRNDRDKRWRALMLSAQHGDGKAYAQLLSELLPLLRRIVSQKWPNALESEDVVQEILVSLHLVRHTYDANRPFMPWLMTIATRRIADAARRRYARSANETTVDVMPETFSGDDTKTEQETSDDQEALSKAMSVLPEGQREAIELLKIQGLSLDEASQVTGKSVASLKTGVHRAIKTMREALERKT
jgi:RNA polymerase sigma factor (sigma-70 family)